jgi:hypothetical protein
MLIFATSLLAACDDFREATGQGKAPPDEFAVVTKAPLIIPPDYNLHPPRPGEAPLNQVEPAESAQQSLFGTNASTTAQLPAGASDSERTLLANAGAENSDPTIRQDLATDLNKSEQAASDDFTNQVMFWEKPTLKDEGLNADAALKDVPVQPAQTQTAANPISGGSNVQTTAAPTPEAATAVAATSALGDSNTQASADSHDTSSATIDKDNKKSSSSSGGWFNWF